MPLPIDFDALEGHARELEFFFHLDLSLDDKLLAEHEELCRRDPRVRARTEGARRLIDELRSLRGTPEADEFNRVKEFIFNSRGEEGMQDVIVRWHDLIMAVGYLFERGHRPPARDHLRELIAIAYATVPAARHRTPASFLRRSVERPQTPDPTDPTRLVYNGLSTAYDHFNARLFRGRLPRCLITLERLEDDVFGAFFAQRFFPRDGDPAVVDGIALNLGYLRYFTSRRRTMSILVHEMVHLEQFHFGTPSALSHNEEWGEFMERAGLVPSATGLPGGERTGRQMSHYVVEDGPFARAWDALAAADCDALRYVQLWDVDPDYTLHAVCREDNSTRPTIDYVCDGCGRRYSGKPWGQLICADCHPDAAELAELLSAQWP